MKIILSYICIGTMLIVIFLLLVLLFYATPACFVGVMTNERVQDQIDNIDTFFNNSQKVFSEDNDNGIADYVYRYQKISPSLIRFSIPVPREYPWGGNIYVAKGRKKISGLHTNGQLIPWNSCMVFEANHLKTIDDLKERVYTIKGLYVGVIIGIICFCVELLLLFFSYRKKDRKHLFELYVFCCVLIIVCFAFLSYNCWKIDRYSYYKSKEFIKHQIHFSDFKILLDRVHDVSLHSAPLFLKEAGIGKVFISRKPFFPYNYIRINLNIFNFLFVSTEEIDLSKINPLLKSKKLSNELWLGYYEEGNLIIHRLSYFTKICSTVFPIVVLLFIICILSTLYSLKKFDTRGNVGSDPKSNSH